MKSPQPQKYERGIPMLNESCIKSVMQYLDKNLVPKRNGKMFGINARRVAGDLSESFSAIDVFQAVSCLVQSGMLTRANPEHPHVAPAVFKINGITPAGYQFLSLLEDDTLWGKLKKTLPLEKILNLLSSGINAAQLLQNFLS